MILNAETLQTLSKEPLGADEHTWKSGRIQINIQKQWLFYAPVTEQMENKIMETVLFVIATHRNKYKYPRTNITKEAKDCLQ